MAGQYVVAFLSGLLFASGLVLSGMTLPQNIIGFLDLQHWKPALIMVMIGAVLVYAVASRVILRRETPILASKFELPTSRQITFRLVGGAALFGVGWGLGGFCSGPALASLAAGRTEVLVFVAALFFGMWLCPRLLKS